MKPKITVDLRDECKKDDKISKCQDPRDFEQKHGPYKDTAWILFNVPTIRPTLYCVEH